MWKRFFKWISWDGNQDAKWKRFILKMKCVKVKKKKNTLLDSMKFPKMKLTAPCVSFDDQKINLSNCIINDNIRQLRQLTIQLDVRTIDVTITKWSLNVSLPKLYCIISSVASTENETPISLQRRCRRNKSKMCVVKKALKLLSRSRGLRKIVPWMGVITITRYNLSPLWKRKKSFVGSLLKISERCARSLQ